MRDTDRSDIDVQLLNALSRDRWCGASAFAEQLGVPVSTVRERLRDLEATGVITGYVPRLNYTALGFDVTAIFELAVAADALCDVTSELRDDRRTVAVYRVTGDTDLIAIGKYETTETMHEQLRTFVTSSTIEHVDVKVVFEAVSEFEPIQLGSGTSIRK
ncbi:Lrp/AsnC family transcriptional regulator [Halococcus agarilyticus]|uniref:Lrp/AsnC family transcriptional regulator n=1 Tax=Halococcus agarilyticus TaxID=1232219 RepID=UPI0006777863|nr:Lrp/AsnC family transcriptional regulator [Halococcus agarilyticus]